MLKNSYYEYFELMPDDIKNMIYSKITYPQSNKLLIEIRDYKIYSKILKLIGYNNVKPTLNNLTNILIQAEKIEPNYSIYIMNIIGEMRLDIDKY